MTKQYCDTCASWRLRLCDGCENFTGTYPPHANPPDEPAKKKKHRPLGMKYAKHGLSPAQQRELLQQQQGQCAICSCEMKPPALDHDHATRKARGYVCYRCNSMLPTLDDKQWMTKAQAYLDNPPAKRFYA